VQHAVHTLAAVDLKTHRVYTPGTGRRRQARSTNGGLRGSDESIAARSSLSHRMATINLIPAVLRTLTRDGWLLFVTRFARLFAYGSLSVILVFYLIGIGLTEAQAGWFSH